MLMLEQLLGAAGGVCRSPGLPTPGQEEVLDPRLCSNSVMLLVHGRLDTLGPPGQILTRAALPDPECQTPILYRLESCSAC